MINFITTSINDPELLEKTYSTYDKNFKNLNLNECTLIINIDPIPNNLNIEKNIEVSKKYFKNVIYNFGTESNFNKANVWCLNQINTKYFFYLQSNKAINKLVDFNIMKQKLENNDKIVNISLSPLVNTEYNNYLSWHPALWKSNWILNTFLPYMSSNVSTEYQLREIGLLENVFSCSYQKLSEGEILYHLGKEWKKKNNYFFGNKSNDKEIFLILKNENWHEKIYNIYKKKEINSENFKNFEKKIIGDKKKVLHWNYRWTGIFGYVKDQTFSSRHILKNSSP